METVGLGMCWEDLKVGYKFRTIGRTITEADLVNFINATGMAETLFICPNRPFPFLLSLLLH